MSSRKGLKQLFFVIGEQAFRSGASLTISILLARSTTKEEYGIYTLLFPLLIIILGVQNGLSSTPYVTILNSVKEKRRPDFLGNILLFHLLVSFFLIVISVSLSLIQNQLNIFPISANIIFIYGFAVASWLLRDFIRQVFLATLAVKLVFVYGVIVNGLTIISICLLYYFDKLSLSTTYVTIIVTSLVPTLLLLFMKRGDVSFSRVMFAEDIKECFYIGKWLVGRALLGLVSGPTILSAQLMAKGNVVDVALFGVCMIPSSILSPLTQALSSFLIPKISYSYINGKLAVKKIVAKFSIFLFLLLVLFNLTIFLSGDFLMEILFSGKYQPSRWLLLIFTAQMSVLIYAIPVNSALVAMQKTKSGFVGELIAAFIVVSAGLPMVHAWGIWGFAFALLSSRVANRGYQSFIYSRLVKVT